jgi:hypothetical protein
MAIEKINSGVSDTTTASNVLDVTSTATAGKYAQWNGTAAVDGAGTGVFLSATTSAYGALYGEAVDTDVGLALIGIIGDANMSLIATTTGDALDTATIYTFVGVGIVDSFHTKKIASNKALIAYRVIDGSAQKFFARVVEFNNTSITVLGSAQQIATFVGLESRILCIAISLDGNVGVMVNDTNELTTDLYPLGISGTAITVASPIAISADYAATSASAIATSGSNIHLNAVINGAFKQTTAFSSSGLWSVSPMTDVGVSFDQTVGAISSSSTVFHALGVSTSGGNLTADIYVYSSSGVSKTVSVSTTASPTSNNLTHVLFLKISTKYAIVALRRQATQNIDLFFYDIANQEILPGSTTTVAQASCRGLISSRDDDSSFVLMGNAASLCYAKKIPLGIATADGIIESGIATLADLVPGAAYFAQEDGTIELDGIERVGIALSEAQLLLL